MGIAARFIWLRLGVLRGEAKSGRTDIGAINAYGGVITTGLGWGFLLGVLKALLVMALLAGLDSCDRASKKR